MSTMAMIDILFVSVVLGGVFYWIFVAPRRARRRRHEEMYGRPVGHFRTWDAGARKRER